MLQTTNSGNGSFFLLRQLTIHRSRWPLQSLLNEEKEKLDLGRKVVTLYNRIVQEGKKKGEKRVRRRIRVTQIKKDFQE